MEYHVSNLGAGVQSTAPYLLAREGKYAFDVAIFADTGEEPGAVYDHLSWLRSLGRPPIWVRSVGRLGDDMMQGVISTAGRFASIPCFTATDHAARPAGEKKSITRRRCTSEYKIQVCNRAIRRELVGRAYGQHMPEGVWVHQYFGITTDEAERTRRTLPEKWSVPVYPFIGMGWSRADCVEYLKGRVPHAVPRSACVFCPDKSNAEWRKLKEGDPEGWRGPWRWTRR